MITQFLDRASQAYYSGHPIIPDEVFDRLAERANYKKVGAQAQGAKVKHVFQMYSLQKHYVDEGADPLANIPGEKVVSPKLDGASLALTYVEGVLVAAATRGDGVEGQDVTSKFIGSALVPQRIPVSGVYQITCEVAAPKHIENARNYAAGALNLNSLEEFKTRAITVFAYAVQPYVHTTYRADMQRLELWGFRTVYEHGIEDIYPTDGTVYRLDDNAKFKELGYTASFPRGAYALKVRGEAVETTLLGVEWQVGKTGKVTPVAILKPVKVGDAEVSRATLNNPGFIRSLDLSIGDTVAVVRAGAIIPQVLYKVE